MLYLSKKKNKLARAGLLIFGLSLFLFGFCSSQRAISVSAADTPSPDAIAIRIIPNPDHYGISRWYSQQGFKGSPQSLTIDGYEALRDGRTVYVNAANINDKGTINITDDELYTNIYLISYNQEAEAATKSILDQIITHWKFNTNIADPVQKDKIVRDTKRLSRLVEIKMAVENYKNKRIDGYYPKLESGTYLAGKTISVWPSWQQTLAKELGVGLPTDPINKLGACKDPEDKNYNSVTCWNEKDKLFADPTPGDSEFNLPAGSNAFVYTAIDNGLDYNVCAVMESGLIVDLKEGACAGSASVKHEGTPSGNNPPTITCGSLTGTAGKEFKGYVSASDSDGDTLNWIENIDISGATWLDSALKPTAVPNQKEIYAAKAGDKGDYSFSITVNDGRTGGQVSKTCAIKIYSACKTDGLCDGNCPDGCTVADDPDCKATGCKPGDGKCDPAVECSTGGSGDCVLADCCGNGDCDSAVGETTSNCPSDCGSAVSGCVFPFDFPCTF